MLTQAAEDYLKTIHKLRQRAALVTNSAVADELRVTPASVTSMMKQLAHLDLVRYVPYQGVELTPDGERVALDVIRHHRLLELYLAEHLGFPWDRVHAEADRLEHHVSPELEARLDAALGHPTADPHGDPIPSPDGVLDEPANFPLAEATPGATLVVRRVSDSDPERLRYLAGLRLVPGAILRVVAVEPFGGPVVVEVGGAERAVGRELAAVVRVSPPVAVPSPPVAVSSDRPSSTSGAEPPTSVNPEEVVDVHGAQR